MVAENRKPYGSFSGRYVDQAAKLLMFHVGKSFPIRNGQNGTIDILGKFNRLVNIMNSACVRIILLHSCIFANLLETLLPSARYATCYRSTTKTHIKYSATQGIQR